MKFKQFKEAAIPPIDGALQSKASDFVPYKKAGGSKKNPIPERPATHQALLPNIPGHLNRIIGELGDLGLEVPRQTPVRGNVGKKDEPRNFDQFAKNAQAVKDAEYADSEAEFDDPREQRRIRHNQERIWRDDEHVKRLFDISDEMAAQRVARNYTRYAKPEGRPTGGETARISESVALKALYDAVKSGRVRPIQDDEILSKYFDVSDPANAETARNYNQTGQLLAQRVRDRLGLEDDTSPENEYLFENLNGTDIDIPEESRTDAYARMQERVLEKMKSIGVGDIGQELRDAPLGSYLNERQAAALERFHDEDDDDYDGESFQSYLTDAQRERWANMTDAQKERAIATGIRNRARAAARNRGYEQTAMERRERAFERARNSLNYMQKNYMSDMADSFDPTDIALMDKEFAGGLDDNLTKILDDDSIPMDTRMGMLHAFMSQAVQNKQVLPISLKQLSNRDIDEEYSALDERNFDVDDYMKALSMMFTSDDPMKLGLSLDGIDGNIDFDRKGIEFPLRLQYEGEDLPMDVKYYAQQHQGSNRDRYYDYRKGGQKFEPSQRGAGARLGQIPSEFGRRQIEEYNPLPEDHDYEEIYSHDDQNKREFSDKAKNYWRKEIKSLFDYKPGKKGQDFPDNRSPMKIGDLQFEDPDEYADAIFELDAAVNDDGVQDQSVIDKYFPELGNLQGMNGLPKYIRGALQRVRTVRAMQNANEKGELKQMIGHGIARAGKQRGSADDPIIMPHLKSHGR